MLKVLHGTIDANEEWCCPKNIGPFIFNVRTKKTKQLRQVSKYLLLWFTEESHTGLEQPEGECMKSEELDFWVNYPCNFCNIL